MSSPIALAVKPTIAEEIRLEAIKVLREALARAEAGDVVSCLVILKHPSGRWSDERTGSMDFPDAIGRLEIVKQAWINSYLREPS